MTLKDYFQDIDGTGVLATADNSGAVDAAVYSKPHVFENGMIGFVMRERLTHHNLQSNPSAAYLFIEEAPGHCGLRLFLKKVKEDADPVVIAPFLKRRLTPEEDRKKGTTYLVTFTVEKILPLTANGETKVVKVV